MPISGNELLILLVIAAFLIGPERLPGYAQQVTTLVRQLRGMARGAQAKIAEEMGPDYKDIDWRQFDPRQYDPRRIVREALMEDLPPTPGRPSPNTGGAAVAGAAAAAVGVAGAAAAGTTPSAGPPGVAAGGPGTDEARGATIPVDAAPFDTEAT